MNHVNTRSRRAGNDGDHLTEKKVKWFSHVLRMEPTVHARTALPWTPDK